MTKLPKRTIVGVLVAALLIVAAIFFQQQGNGGNGDAFELRRSEFLMSTVVEALVYTEDEALGQDALSAAYRRAAELEAIMDRHQSDSDVAKINAAAGQNPVAVSEETFEVIRQGVEFGQMTGGAFDITVAPVMDLWGFGSGENRVPDEEELERALELVDYRKIHLDEERLEVFLEKEGMELDLGGIAKGYIVDQALLTMQEMGIESASFDAGGDIRVLGIKPDGTPWRIGIRDPRDRTNLAAIVELDDQSVVTSGDYERFFMEDGQRYHHILDPDTGFPTRGLTSVTVLGKDAITTDTLSTGLFVMGLESGMELIESLADTEAIFITDDGQVHTSSGLDDQVEIL
ncbi:FAD:protein FMN transferase [Dethiobacter alkaliphilus]|uniref:FAD:protein FMN transferase n=1 Tax=Dethiobacter alkaliphilus TaxID=427926 RepID=UPI0022272EB6|nr:FAD:protein FMN transferase [Dethiobacter alkaliphilus]MCW3491357.1 FAD:protein FMN transferase [Dethiobacter alkaliphilus]